MRLSLPLLTALAVLALPAPAPAAMPCTPGGAPVAQVPTWEAVNGFPLGARQATNAEVEKFIAAVDTASDRVTSSVAGRSFGTRAMPLVFVGAPEHVTTEGRERIAARMRALRDAARGTPSVTEADTAIIWISAGVHGNEPSATDGHMRLLYELASTTDCATTVRLDRLLTVFFPLQNPDGRARGQRTNGYRFDLNRDWFARTQPETRVKVELLEQYPPILYVDGHEQQGTAGFFPPNADPIYHEIADEPLHHINDVYGPAMRTAFESEGLDYTNYTTYDLFFEGYGDTVPSTLFGAAGMTFEKGGQDVYSAKEHEHWLLADTVVRVAAERRTELLRDWARQWTTARDQGGRGDLEPNVVVQPENAVRFPVPAQKTYAYVLRHDAHTADAAMLVNRLRTVGVQVDRLRRPLRAPGFRAFGSRAVATVTLPKDTYIVRMNQSRKHWVQALLADDTYVPFPYFYDVSGWSNPLLIGLEGGVLTAPLNKRAVKPRSKKTLSILRPVGVGTPGRQRLARGVAYAFPGDAFGSLELLMALVRQGTKVSRAAAAFTSGSVRFDRGTVVVRDADLAGLDTLRRLAAVHRSRLHTLRALPGADAALRTIGLPKVALLRDPVGDLGDTTVDDVGLPVGGAGVAASLAQSEGWARWLLERRLGLEVTRVTEAQLPGLVAAGFTALIVPDGALGGQALTPAGMQAVQDFVRAGGTYVGFRAQGLGVAQAAGLTAAQTEAAPSNFQVPGASMRAVVDDTSPVTWGLGERTWIFNTGDPIVATGSSEGLVAASYAQGSEFFVSGYTEGADAVQGTPVVLDETLGSGHAVIFTADAAFRGYVESTERMVVNALLYPRDATVALPGRAGGSTPAGRTGGSAPAGRTGGSAPTDRTGAGRANAPRAAPARRSAASDSAPGVVRPRLRVAAPLPVAVVRVSAAGEAALRAAARAEGLADAVARAVRGGAELRLPGARSLSGHPDARLVRIVAALRSHGTRPTFLAL